MQQIEQCIEALIFASDQSIRKEEIIFCLQATFERDFPTEEVEQHLEQIRLKYAAEHMAIELKNINNGYQFLTKPGFNAIITQLQIQRSKKKLSQAALETLAIIGYRQPITKLEIEQIRGVNCDYSVQKLLDKELITIVGKADSVGKPLLYGTSPLFMDYFGINNVADLPQLKDVAPEGTEIGEKVE